MFLRNLETESNRTATVVRMQTHPCAGDMSLTLSIRSADKDTPTPAQAKTSHMAKILIADDSRFQVQLISVYLEPKGFAVVSAGDALQTWMKALREKPEAIVLDLNMPGGTGIEVLKRLRMSDKTRHIPVVVVSGSSEPNIECTVKALGAHEFLQKPVDPSQLCEILSRLLAPLSPTKND